MTLCFSSAVTERRKISKSPLNLPWLLCGLPQTQSQPNNTQLPPVLQVDEWQQGYITLCLLHEDTNIKGQIFVCFSWEMLCL